MFCWPSGALGWPMGCESTRANVTGWQLWTGILMCGGGEEAVA